MREIKFRAWNPDSKVMFQVNHLQLSGDQWAGGEKNKDEGASVLLRNGDLMQFTGLLDKNGREIYESDIVMVYGEPRVVEFKQQWWMFTEKNFHKSSFDKEMLHCGLGTDLGDEGFKPLYRYGKNLEVIGNTYENTELLTK